MRNLTPASRPFDAAEFTAPAPPHRNDDQLGGGTTGLAFSAAFATSTGPPWPLLPFVALLALSLAIETALAA